MRRIETRPIADAALALVAQLIAYRSNCDEITDRLERKAASWRLVIDGRSGVLALALVDHSDKSTSILDSLIITPDDPDAGLSVDAWMDAALERQPKH